MTFEARPVYLKLRDIIAASILDGEYGEGASLPSVRALAAKEGANPLTVAKAYQLFQDQGLVTVRRGIGLFVAKGAVTKLRNIERDYFWQDVWPEISAHIRRAGISPHELAEKISG
jgi:GntR family transcriptional regulator